MEKVMLYLCGVADVYIIMDFFKPIFQRKHLKNGYKIKLISPILQYLILLTVAIGVAWFLYQFIINKDSINFLNFSMLFFIGMWQLSKSFVIICKEGLFVDGTYFSNEEKQEGEEITYIVSRRIYRISTLRKSAYALLGKRHIRELTNREEDLENPI